MSTGLDAREQALQAANAFMRHNGISVCEVTPQRSVAILDIVPESLNSYGVLHGGAYFTMADVAGGALARSDGRSHMTVSSSLNFVRPVRSGRVTATACLRHRGRSTCLISVTVTDQTGNLLACGELTFFCVTPSAPPGGSPE